mgnify:CR=1 FL=1
MERAQALADKAGITRHKLIHNLVTTGLETLEELDSIGVIRGALMVRNALDYLKTKKKGEPEEKG